MIFILKKVLEVLFCVAFGFSYVNISKEVKNEIIYIDPGHGGIDGGCIGSDETLEKDINLQIALFVRDNLVSLGYVVELTRSGDYDLASKNSKNRKREDLEKRYKLMNNSLLYVSIHANSYPGNARGAQTFYHTEEGKILATLIQDNIKEMFNNTKRTPLMLHDKYILDNITSPGCIVEVGFLSNSEELKLLKDPTYQKNMGLAISIGIINYITYIEQG